MKTNPTTKMEKRLLMALLGVFGTLTTVLTALSRPSLTDMLLALGVALACVAGIVWLSCRPAWHASLTEAGIRCIDDRSGAERLLGWDAYRCAYELRTIGGARCTVLATGPRTRSELTRAYRRCAVTGECVADGCICVWEESGASDLLSAHGVERSGAPVLAA